MMVFSFATGRGFPSTARRRARRVGMGRRVSLGGRRAKPDADWPIDRCARDRRLRAGRRYGACMGAPGGVGWEALLALPTASPLFPSLPISRKTPKNVTKKDEKNARCPNPANFGGFWPEARGLPLCSTSPANGDARLPNG